jgi:hypothetical protein
MFIYGSQRTDTDGSGEGVQHNHTNRNHPSSTKVLHESPFEKEENIAKFQWKDFFVLTWRLAAK